MQQQNERNLNNQNRDQQNCINCIVFNKSFPCKTPKYLKYYGGISFLFFLILAIITFIINIQIKSHNVIYAEKNICKKTKLESQKCSVDIKIEQDMKGPVYFLYYIENIYVNHKRYIQSFSPQQLSGKTIDTGTAQQQCKPIVFNRDLPVNISWGGQPLDPNAVASPCGLKPMLFFNDTFRIYNQNGDQIQIDQQQVARTNDKRMKRQAQSESIQWIDPQNQHFISYMRTGSLMTKKRLWGRIQQGLKKGQYTVLMQNNYRINQLEIEKGIELTTTTAFGGKNHFFPICFLIAALTCLVYSIIVGYNLDKYETLIKQSLKND